MTKQPELRYEASGTERTMMDEAASQLLVPEKGRDLAQLSRGSGRGRGSIADFAKVRADFWQADVRSGVSQESADLLHGFTLQALGPISLSSNSLQKFPSNNLVQGFSRTGHLT